jgi:sugar O-acyltransferase (sialic acid O-acetyltransferase NeuD family)
MKRTILVGGGGFCRELIDAVSTCHEAGSVPAVGGYLDDAGDVLGGFDIRVPWLGSTIEYQPQPDDVFVLAIASPAGKRVVHGRLHDRGARFPRLIHPTVNVAPTAMIAEGVMILFNGAAGPNCRIERMVTINTGSGLGHDAVVGEFSTLSSKVDITGGVQVGSDCLIGSNAALIPKIKIGNGATIGAGCVIYRSVPAGATMFAPPARMLKAGR